MDFVLKLDRIDTNESSRYNMYCNGNRIPYSADAYLPATLQEYNDYINKQ